MAEYKTRLSYILSRIGLRPVELSRQTGIDKTVISRWQNGKRHFPPSGGMARSVAACMLAQPGAREIIERMLVAGGYDDAPKTLQQNLMLWLSEESMVPPIVTAKNEKGATQYTATFTVFLGYEGLRRAGISLIEFADSNHRSEREADVLAVMWGSNKWFSGSEAFNQDLFRTLDVAFRNNLRFSLAHPDNFAPEDISLFAGNWLAANLSGAVRSLDLQAEPATGVLENGQSHLYAAAKDCISLRMLSNSEVADGIYGNMYTDAVSNSQIYQICEEYVAKSKPRYRLGFLQNPGADLAPVTKAVQLASNAYLCAPLPTLGTMEAGEVHLHAKLSKKAVAPMLVPLRPLLALPPEYAPGATVRHIYSAAAIEGLFQRPRTRDAALSAMFGATVNHSRKLMLQQLRAIRHWLQTLPGYEVAFLPGELFAHLPLSFSVVQNCFTVGWLEENGQSTCSTRENRVGALYGYAELEWQRLPRRCTNRQNALRQLDAWLEQYAFYDA